MRKGEGLFYRPSEPPQTNDPYALRQWCQREFDRIADALFENRGAWVRVDILTELPARSIEGMAACFAAGVVAPGSSKGFYEYVSGAWVKL